MFIRIGNTLQKSILILTLLFFVWQGVAQQKDNGQADAVKLGATLTPLGGELAGNADGSIPRWTPITSPPKGYRVGDFHPDPFSSDRILFTLTTKNYKQYQKFLSPGQEKMFLKYPDTFKMHIYQSRRTASNPDYVYAATKKNAIHAELDRSGFGVKGAAIGIPFPLPKTGLEAIWNHLLRFRGTSVSRTYGQASPTANGNYTIIGFRDQTMFNYSEKGSTAEDLSTSNNLLKFKQIITTPARLAGTALLVHEPLDAIQRPRQAWRYHIGQRRVRRAANVAFDAPSLAADGLMTQDDNDMFNGTPDRYTWKLKGKQEIYIPYNNYKLHSNDLRYSDILKAKHINPAHVRWEKHRVWVVEATLKTGMRHLYHKRVFYIDEDSWQIHLTDIYDKSGNLFRHGVAHGINYYDVLAHWSTLDVFHDFNSARYTAIGLDNEERMYDFSALFTDREFTPSTLRREGRR